MDVGQNIPHIYAELDNRQIDHQTSIINMESNLYVQLVSILIDPRSNYSYISLDLVDKCCLNKEVHNDSWLVWLGTGTKKIFHHWVKYCAFKLKWYVYISAYKCASFGII